MDHSSFTRKDYIVLKHEMLYEGHFRLSRLLVKHKLFNGGWSEAIDRELFERPSAAALLPYDPIKDQIVMIEQFRVGALANHPSPWLLEIIAGVYEKDEDPDVVAIRESEEEANCKITDLIPLYEYFVSPGGSDEHLTLFCGKIDTGHVDGIFGLKHEHEDIKTYTIDREEALKLLSRGLIRNAPTIIALQWLQINHLWLKEKWKK